jgi:hypothetical protein
VFVLAAVLLAAWYWMTHDGTGVLVGLGVRVGVAVVV